MTATTTKNTTTTPLDTTDTNTLINIDASINTWTDEECLFYFTKFLDRVNILTKFEQNEDTAAITHEVIIVQCGDMYIESDPMELEWPLLPMDLPVEFKKMVN